VLRHRSPSRRSSQLREPTASRATGLSPSRWPADVLDGRPADRGCPCGETTERRSLAETEARQACPTDTFGHEFCGSSDLGGVG
jgi:hypothetical protein